MKVKARDRIRLPDGQEMTLGEAMDAGLVALRESNKKYFAVARSIDGPVSWEIGKTLYLSRMGQGVFGKDSGRVHPPARSSLESLPEVVGFWIWEIDQELMPVALYGPFGKPREADHEASARAERSERDHVVTFGDDPESNNFEILRSFEAGSGEIHDQFDLARVSAQLPAYRR